MVTLCIAAGCSESLTRESYPFASAPYRLADQALCIPLIWHCMLLGSAGWNIIVAQSQYGHTDKDLCFAGYWASSCEV